MKRQTILAAVVTVLGVAAPVLAALPFGNLEGKQLGGNAGGGVLGIVGWAVDDDGVAAVDILVDGLVVGRASYGLPRADVPKIFPGFPGSPNFGFIFFLDTTRHHNGLHGVSARVHSKLVGGESADLNTKILLFTNSIQNLAPFGTIGDPLDNAELYGDCDLTHQARFYTPVTGWVLDSGTQPDNEGVRYVELEIDHALWSNSILDCTYLIPAGGFTDCYGLPRQDVAQLYPYLKDAPHAGYRFVLDVGFLVGSGFYNQGLHTLTIRSGDIAGQVTDPADIVVTFSCTQNQQNAPSFGFIGSPRPGFIYSGTVPVSGWALDFEGISAVEVLVDGFSVGTATYGLPRGDVTALFPGYPNSAAPGWTFNLDTKKLANGARQLQARVTDVAAKTTFIGQRIIIVNNP